MGSWIAAYQEWCGKLRAANVVLSKATGPGRYRLEPKIQSAKADVRAQTEAMDMLSVAQALKRPLAAGQTRSQRIQQCEAVSTTDLPAHVSLYLSQCKAGNAM